MEWQLKLAWDTDARLEAMVAGHTSMWLGTLPGRPGKLEHEVKANWECKAEPKKIFV